MSIEALNWAWTRRMTKTRGSAAARKLVLMRLADRADEYGRCRPGVRSLSLDAEVHHSTLDRLLDELEHIDHLLHRVRRPGRTNFYVLHLPTTEGKVWHTTDRLPGTTDSTAPLPESDPLDHPNVVPLHARSVRGSDARSKHARSVRGSDARSVRGSDARITQSNPKESKGEHDPNGYIGLVGSGGEKISTVALGDGSVIPVPHVNPDDATMLTDEERKTALAGVRKTRSLLSASVAGSKNEDERG